MDFSSADLFTEIDSLKASFASLSAQLKEASEQFTSSAAVPPAELFRDLEEYRREAASLRTRISELGDRISAPAAQLPGAAATSPEELSQCLLALAKIEAERARAALHQSAVTVMDRLLSVVHREQGIFAPLAEYQNRARQLRESIMSHSGEAAHPAAADLAGGKHAICRLLDLIERQGDLTDDEWLRLQAIASEEFRKELVVAAARGKLEVRNSVSGAAGVSAFAPADSARPTTTPKVQLAPELEEAIQEASRPTDPATFTSGRATRPEAQLLYEKSLAIVERDIVEKHPEEQESIAEIFASPARAALKKSLSINQPEANTEPVDQPFRMTLESQKSSPTIKDGFRKAVRAFKPSS